MIKKRIPIYKRILLKISGESLCSSKDFGINLDLLENIAKNIKYLIDVGVQIGLVVGGGNLFRGMDYKGIGINRVTGDCIGMLSTVINGLIVRDVLQKFFINTQLMSSIFINGICNFYNYMEAINFLKDGYVVLFSAGIGNPFFTTDSSACIRGVEIKADILLKATKVNGVYSTDPKFDENAVFYKTLSYKDVIEKKLRIMDLTAFILAQDHNLPIRIFNIYKKDIIKNIIFGKEEGTLISKK